LTLIANTPSRPSQRADDYHRDAGSKWMDTEICYYLF